MIQHHPYRKARACCRHMHDETLKKSHTPSPCRQTCCWAAGHFRILSKDNALPLVAFSLTKTVDKNGKEEARQYTEFDLADKLRQRGWVLPAYTMAPDARWIPCCQHDAASLHCMNKTDCFEETRLVLHVPSSSRAGKQTCCCLLSCMHLVDLVFCWSHMGDKLRWRFCILLAYTVVPCKC